MPLGDSVAVYLTEDLYTLNRSAKLNERISKGERVQNTQNKRRGIIARRGDGTFGEIIPNEIATSFTGFHVLRGPIATIEIGAEVKILFKAMIKQIDRVMGNMEDQLKQFRKGGGSPISIAFVGINHADSCTSYEGSRKWPTDGRSHKHPIQEAAAAEARIAARVSPQYDELLFMRFRASNVRPFTFEWINQRETEMDYGAILTRVLRRYEQLF